MGQPRIIDHAHAMIDLAHAMTDLSLCCHNTLSQLRVLLKSENCCIARVAYYISENCSASFEVRRIVESHEVASFAFFQKGGVVLV